MRFLKYQHAPASGAITRSALELGPLPRARRELSTAMLSVFTDAESAAMCALASLEEVACDELCAAAHAARPVVAIDLRVAVKPSLFEAATPAPAPTMAVTRRDEAIRMLQKLAGCWSKCLQGR